MPTPPPTPPSSDITGVNRDARAGRPHSDGSADPGAQIAQAKDESKAQPDETAPPK